MRVVVFGGDGFCGWPVSLHLSAAGHEVTIVDDLSRRQIMRELGAESLTPIVGMADRLAAWEKRSGRLIRFHNLDACVDLEAMRDVLRDADAVVHLAEQSSAPYSMKNAANRQYTVFRNLMATNNILIACPPQVPVVHFGTMGVYGYGGDGGALPEGWIAYAGRRMLHPFAPGSIYHATKCMDAVLLEFCARNDGHAITDLHQGIVWGTQTEETSWHGDLVNSFSWDGDYGTVLNRFLMQAAVGHPLTVHGTGGQTRAFIHLRDTVRCVRMAVEHPAKPGEYRVFNQAAECLRVRDLAAKVAKMTGAEIAYVDNPRKEAAENDLSVENMGLKSLGWKPTTLDDALLADVVQIARRHRSRAKGHAIPCVSRW